MKKINVSALMKMACIILAAVLLNGISGLIEPQFVRAEAQGVIILDWSWVHEDDKVVVQAVIRNDNGGRSHLGLVAIGYDGNNQAVEVGYSGSSGTLSAGYTRDYTVTLTAGSQIDHVGVIASGNVKSGTVEVIASGYRYEDGQVIVTGVVENGSEDRSFIGIAAIGYNTSSQAVEVGYSGSSGTLSAGYTRNYTVTLSAGSLIKTVKLVSPYSYLDGKLSLIEKGYYVESDTIHASAAVHNDTDSSERVTMTVNGYNESGTLTITRNTSVTITSKNVSRLSLSVNAANVHRVEVILDGNELVAKEFPGVGDKPKITVSGKIRSYNPSNLTTIQLMRNDKEIDKIIIPAEPGSGQRDQDFEFNGVAPGTYTLIVTKPAHTAFTVKTITVGDEDVDLTKDSRPEVRLMTLRCGDLNGDGVTDNRDLTILWLTPNYYRDTVQAANPLCDLSGDGVIDNRDLTILWMTYNYYRGEIVIE